MADRIDPRKLHTAPDGTKRDYEGSIRNNQGFLISKSPERIRREAQQAQQEQQIINDHIAEEKEMFRNAVKKAGGLFYVPRLRFNIGFAGLFLIGFFVLGFLAGFKLFLESPDGTRMIRNIGDFFSMIGFHIAAFLFAWPQTFTQMFDHWFYLPELLLGIFLIYYLIKTADDSDFYREDGIKCMVPYLLIEGIRALFLKYSEFTKLACILRGLGLGIGLCIIVWLLRKILIRR